MISAATRVKEDNLVEEHESGYRQKWNKGQVLENDQEELLQDSEFILGETTSRRQYLI